MSEATLTRIEQLADELSFEEQLNLVEHLAQSLRQMTRRRQPQDLYGIWRDRFPPDFDLEVALSDIRHTWEQERLQGTIQ